MWAMFLIGLLLVALGGLTGEQWSYTLTVAGAVALLITLYLEARRRRAKS